MLTRKPAPLPTAPGQESVWAYPRPPRLEPVPERLRIVFDGETIADTSAGWRVLETSHPPTYYLPPDAFRPGGLVRAAGGSLCEWKGRAVYYDVVGPRRWAERAAWAYPTPTAPFAAIADHVAVYAAPTPEPQVGGCKRSIGGGEIMPDCAL